MAEKLKEDAIALYDRQIRLWGAAAQAKLGLSSVVLIGCGGLGSEIAKNLVLGGIGKLTVIDDGYTKSDEPGFLLDVTNNSNKPITEAIDQRLKELNPRVQIETLNISWKTIELESWAKFDVILATQQCSEDIEALNELSRSTNKPLIVSSCHGLFGIVFIDAINSETWISKEKNSSRSLGYMDPWELKEIIKIEDLEENNVLLDRCLIKSQFRKWNERSSKYIHCMYPKERRLLKKVSPTFVTMLALLDTQSDENYSYDLLTSRALEITQEFEIPTKLVNTEITKRIFEHSGINFQPVAAILGGFVSQTTINLIVKKEITPNNLVILDGYTNEMPVYTI